MHTLLTLSVVLFPGGVAGFAVSSLIGVALGFMFGVGCALAVMYSIYMGGYREALRDMALAVKPKRWDEEMAKVRREAGK